MSGAARRGAIKRIAQACGVEIRRIAPGAIHNRCSLVGSMRTAASVGFSPATILDVGAARGEWTLEAASVWPGAKFLLVDPPEENRAALTRVAGQVRNAAFEMAAVGREVGSTVIHVHPDLDGSSLYEEREEAIKGTIRSVAATTVDRVVQDHGLPGPFLLKADVQGAELAMVDGAALTLAQTELCFLEVTASGTRRETWQTTCPSATVRRSDADSTTPGRSMVTNARSQCSRRSPRSSSAPIPEPQPRSGKAWPRR